MGTLLAPQRAATALRPGTVAGTGAGGPGDPGGPSDPGDPGGADPMPAGRRTRGGCRCAGPGALAAAPSPNPRPSASSTASPRQWVSGSARDPPGDGWRCGGNGTRAHPSPSFNSGPVSLPLQKFPPSPPSRAWPMGECGGTRGLRWVRVMSPSTRPRFWGAKAASPQSGTDPAPCRANGRWGPGTHHGGHRERTPPGQWGRCPPSAVPTLPRGALCPWGPAAPAPVTAHSRPH